MSKRIRHPKKIQSSFQNSIRDLKVGDCIVVKPGVKDPDYGINIGGWQGRITEIESYQPGQVTIMFQWDSLSLKRMPASAIRRSEENGLDWSTMGLYPEEVEHAEPRDTQADVDALIEELSVEHGWDYLGKQGQRIHVVLQDVDEDDEFAAFEAWHEHLEAHLKLPFEAAVSESQDRGPLRFGDRVKVIGFEGVEDLYGVLVNINAGRDSYVFPLCDLKAVNEKSTNFTLTDDYAVWFANR
jgi:phenylpyruvate tautomerase PptA (4-oxalocrotonate tautomerase family)